MVDLRSKMTQVDLRLLMIMGDLWSGSTLLTFDLDKDGRGQLGSVFDLSWYRTTFYWDRLKVIFSLG